MKINKWMVLLVILSLIGTGILYPYLPEQVPGHWNVKGQIDRYQNKTWVFFTAMLPLLLYLFMTVLPKIDPKKKAYLKHTKAYDVTRIMIVLFLVIIHWVTITVALGYDINVGFVMRILTGILFILLGNYMSQIRPNYFFGIKTPWTLANEQVWKKTHRVGGYSFIIMGIISIVTAFLEGQMGWMVMMVGIVAAVLYPFVYSYLLFNKIEK
ncbi:SdpI family protein [Clostridiaceae bacterium 35-E11]